MNFSILNIIPFPVDPSIQPSLSIHVVRGRKNITHASLVVMTRFDVEVSRNPIPKICPDLSSTVVHLSCHTFPPFRFPVRRQILNGWHVLYIVGYFGSIFFEDAMIKKGHESWERISCKQMNMCVLTDMEPPNEDVVFYFR